MCQYSIIVPVYNVEQYLCECVDSILNQETNATMEIILVDDGSSDGSGNICDAYAQKYNTIRVIHGFNQGVSHARNVGIQAARGEYILFIDADDRWKKNLLDVFSKQIKESPDVVVFGGVRFKGESEYGAQIVSRIIPNGESGPLFLQKLFAIQALPLTVSWAYGFRRKFLENNNIRFDESMKVSEDFDFNMACLQRASSVKGTSEILYEYRMREQSATATISPKKILDNLQCKAKWYQCYPVSALADKYVDNVLLIGRLQRKEARKVTEILCDNKELLNNTWQKSCAFAVWLFRLFGFYEGARIYMQMKKLIKVLRGKRVNE